MQIKIITSLIVFLFYFNNCNSQNFRMKNNLVFINFDYSHSSSLLGNNQIRINEYGINFISQVNKQKIFEYGIHFATDVIKLNNENIYGPKIGISFDRLIFKKSYGFCGKLNFIKYYSFKNNEFRISPELGFTYLGVINLYYGYSFPLKNSTLPEIPNHYIKINFNVGYNRILTNLIRVGTEK